MKIIINFTKGVVLAQFFTKNKIIKMNIKNILLTLFSLLLTFVILELVARIFVTERSTSLNIGILNKKFAKKNYQTNSLGMRDIEFSSKINKEKNILFIGDSFTFGNGVKTNEIFPNVVLYGQNDYDIFNLALPGSNTESHYKTIKENLIRYKQFNFNYVVYQYLGNDVDYLIYQHPPFSSFDLFMIDKMKRFYLIDYLYSPLLGIKFGKNYNNDLIKVYNDDVKFNQHSKDIKKIFELANINNINLIFLPFPYINNKKIFILSKNYIKKMEYLFNANCKKGDVYIDAFQVIEELNEEEWRVSKLDSHPSPKVHNLIGINILKALNKTTSKNILYCDK